jgi:hypothetical protein
MGSALPPRVCGELAACASVPAQFRNICRLSGLYAPFMAIITNGAETVNVFRMKHGHIELHLTVF